MVQYKRKPVTYIDPPAKLPRKTEVWAIGQTNELFTDYESYLQRLDYYRQKKFTCEITGHTGLTYFEARESELDQTKDLDSSFPEKLREPVLRKAQFSTISRINDLVNKIYSDLQQDFFPGESVLYTDEEGRRWEGTIREKTNHSARRNSDGTVRPPFARYTVEAADDGADHHAELANLSRERKTFNKQMLRSYLKGSLQREAWLGAPWIVRPSLAASFRLSTDVPVELRYETKMAERRHAASLKAETNGIFANVPLNHSRPLGQNGKWAKDGSAVNGNHVSHSKKAKSKMQQQQMPPPPPPPKEPSPTPPPPIKYPIEDLDIVPKSDGVQRPPLSFMVDNPPSQKLAKAKAKTGLEMRSVGPLLEIWNTLNVLCEVFILDSFTFDDFVDCMLFAADDVNCQLFCEVHCAVLKQLVDESGELQVTLPEFDSEDEDEEEEEEEEEGSEGSEENEEEEEEQEEVEQEKTPTPEPTKPARRTTRSSLAKEELLKKEPSPSVAAEEEEEEEEEEGPTHLAPEMQGDRDWAERLKARDFRDGGWQVIMVGLLHQASLNPHEAAVCEEVLTHLAPVDMEASQETARQQYVTLDVNLRVAALEIACMMAIRTKAVRAFLEQCSEQMTDLRKDKIEVQRKRKPLLEELRELDEQRKLLLPDNMPGTPPPETNGEPEVKVNGVNGNGKLPDALTPAPDDEAVDTDDGSGESEDEDLPRRGLRRAAERMNERKRKRDDEIARKERLERERLEASRLGKMSPQFKKLLRDIDKKKEAIKKLEDTISELDGDLREANCQRTKCLGRDRYCYRYYWYERNGMPFAGLPNSSTAHHGYANARIWVQGPDDMEREGYLDLTPDREREYVEHIGMTVENRRSQEEGETRLLDAHHWGYIDDPAAVDRLVAWLDGRGLREKSLKKELIAWRDPIVECMRKMRAHLLSTTRRTSSTPLSFPTPSSSSPPPLDNGTGGKEEEEEDDGAEEGSMATARVSTRNRTYPTLELEAAHPCLAWENRYAKYELGHLHSEPPRPKARAVPRGAAAAAATAAKPTRAAKVVEEREEEEEAVPMKRKKKKEKGGGGKKKKKEMVEEAVEEEEEQVEERVTRGKRRSLGKGLGAGPKEEVREVVVMPNGRTRTGTRANGRVSGGKAGR